MIIDKTLKIKTNNQNVQYYINLGYDCKGGDEIVVNTDDLSKGSSILVKVKCDICEKHNIIEYRKYYKNYNNGNFYSCKSCIEFKVKKTKKEKYGDENYRNYDKYLLTMNIKYKCDHPMKSDKIKEKVKKTRVERGLEISIENIDNFNDYRKMVNIETRKNKKILFQNWDGCDFYDNEYIKNNLSLHFNNINYPTIDHKISVYEGFKNKIDPIIIGSIDNLCITKRFINCKKGFKGNY